MHPDSADIEANIDSYGTEAEPKSVVDECERLLIIVQQMVDKTMEATQAYEYKFTWDKDEDYQQSVGILNLAGT